MGAFAASNIVGVIIASASLYAAHLMGGGLWRDIRGWCR